MPTYYVANNGSNSADGLTTDTAWQTIAKVNGFTFAANDTILLRRGDRWRETLTIPRSSLTFGAYGAAAVYDNDGYCTNAPIIDGGELVTGWSSYSGGVNDNYAEDDISGTAGQTVASASTMEIGGPWVNQTSMGSAPVLTAAGRARRGTGQFSAMYATGIGPSSEYGVQADAYIASATTGDRSHVLIRCDPPTQQNWYGFQIDPAAGTLALTRTANASSTTLYSTAKTWTVGSTYLIRIEARVDNNLPRLTGYIDGEQVFDHRDTGSTYIYSRGYGGLRFGGATAPADGSDSTGVHFKNFAVTPLVAGATPVNTYQATLAAEARLVDLRGAYSPNGESMNNLPDGWFFWKSGVLYVRSNAGIPSNTDVIAGTRANAINLGSQSNTTLQDIAIEHTNDRSIVITGGGSGTVIQRVSMQRTSSGTGQNGAISFNTHTNWTVDSCVMRDIGSDAIYANGVNYPIVTNNRIGPTHGPTADCLQFDNSTSALNATVTDNYFTQIGSATVKGCVVIQGATGLFARNTCVGGQNFGVAPYGNDMTVEDNFFLQNGPGGAIRMRDPAVSNVTIVRNLIVDCKVAIWLDATVTTARTGHVYVNNTIVNIAVPPETDQAMVWLDDTISGTFKNNIVYNASGQARKVYHVKTAGAGGWDSDYNLLSPEGTDFIRFTGTLYATLAAYVAGKSKDAHSVTGNPLFVNLGGTATADYWLLPLSPAAHAGVTVAGITDDPAPNIGAMDIYTGVPTRPSLGGSFDEAATGGVVTERARGAQLLLPRSGHVDEPIHGGTHDEHATSGEVL